MRLNIVQTTAEQPNPRRARLNIDTVKKLWPLLLFPPLLFPAEPTDLTPRIGVIEIYGVRKGSLDKIQKALNVKPGDRLPPMEQTEDRINKVSNIVSSRLEAACCQGNDMILYVGVEERDSPRMEFHSTPAGNIQLAPSLIANYRRFLDEVEDSIRGKNADEDLTNGYSLMADPDCRNLQTEFLASVASDLANILQVVHQSADPEQRAAAAYLLQYAPRSSRTTPSMINGVQWALQDEDASVRISALSSFRAIMVGSTLHPDRDVRFEPTWLVALMNSVVLSDRFRASEALATLTDGANSSALDLIRSRALASVLEMARWHDLKRALPAFMLAGRLAGLNEAQIKQAWLNEDRASVLKAAALTSSKHGKSKS